jgi:hypothetical protein
MGGVLLVTFLSRQEKQLAIGRNLSKPCIKNNELAPGHLILLGKSRYTPGHYLLLRNSPCTPGHFLLLRNSPCQA